MSVGLLVFALLLSAFAVLLFRLPIEGWAIASGDPELKQVARAVTIAIVLLLILVCLYGAFAK